MARVTVSAVKVSGKAVKPSAVGQALGREITARVAKGSSKLRPLMQDSLLAVYAALEKRHGKQWGSGKGLFGGGPYKDLRRRSGKGLDSIRKSIKVRYTGNGGVAGSITAGTMGIHEKGGVITSSGYMAIPTVYAMNAKGVRVRSAWDSDRNFIRRTKKDNLFIFERVGKGKGRTIKPLFLLRRKVKIPGRLGLVEAVRKQQGYFKAKAAKAMLESVR